jgi:hypothetical protein
MTKVVRHTKGKVRPHNAPWYTLYPRRMSSHAGGALRRRWRTVNGGEDAIVGRRELSQCIVQTLRDRKLRKPYLLVGGVGVGKTAVLVELTRMLAHQGAVPVPIHLRDADGHGDLDFEKMAKRRMAEEADQGVLASGQIDKAWRQLRLDDKVVVLADGLEEALLDEGCRDDRDNIIRRAIDRADRQKLPLIIASPPCSAGRHTGRDRRSGTAERGSGPGVSGQGHQGSG